MVARKKRSAPRRRKVSRKRRNSWPNDAVGHSRAAKKGWRRRRRASAKAKSPARRKKTASVKRKRRTTRTNPSHSLKPAGKARRTYRRKSRRRAVRYNPPKFLKRLGLTRSGITNAATVGAGVGIGYLGMPLIVRFMPSDTTVKHRKFYGLAHVLLGGILFAGSRRKASPLRLMGTTVAGMGIYDLIASNLPLGLPVLPDTLAPGILSDAISGGNGSDIDEPVGASYPKHLGANYDPPALMGASYSAPSFRTEGLGADDPFDGIFE